MATLTTYCPYCDQKHNYRPESADTVTRCRGCGANYKLPPLSASSGSSCVGTLAVLGIVGGVALVSLLACMGLFGGRRDGQPAPPAKPAPVPQTQAPSPLPASGPVRIEAAAARSAFLDDKVEAERRYRGRLLELTAEVYAITTRHKEDGVGITLSTADPSFVVAAWFKGEGERRAASLSKGQRVCVRGRFDGATVIPKDGSVFLTIDGCELVEATATPAAVAKPSEAPAPPKADPQQEARERERVEAEAKRQAEAAARQRREESAQSELNIAKRLLKDAQQDAAAAADLRDKARRRLERMIKTYPDTRAAAEGKRLLADPN